LHSRERKGKKKKKKAIIFLCFCFRLNVVILEIVKMLKSAGSEKVSSHSGVIICSNLPNWSILYFGEYLTHGEETWTAVLLFCFKMFFLDVI